MSNNKQQTAVEKFIEKLRELGYLGIDYSPELLKAIEQAKEMEREQHYQTAVEWYGKQMGLLFQQFHWHKISITEFHYKRLELEEQAKEMEKEQMIDFALECQEMFKHQIIEKYNETYGGNK